MQANHAPTAPTLSAQSWTKNTPVNLVLPAFTDADGDTLSYSVSGLPAGLTFNAATLTISGTPTTAGSGTITYTANDGRGGVVNATFAYSVANPVGNQAPVVTNLIPDTTMTSGQANTFALALNTFTDPEGQTLTWSAKQSSGG